jgi:site-specific recombinase XerD
MTGAIVGRVSEKHSLDAHPGSKPVSVRAAARPLPRRRAIKRHPGIYHRPRPDGKIVGPYEFAYLDSTGKRRWQTVHGSLQDTSDARDALRLRRRRGERVQPSRQTFEQYAREWLSRRNVRPRSLEKDRWALEQHLIPYFGRYRLDQIQAEDIAAFINTMRRRKLKGWTITSALGPLSTILAQATRKGRIPSNPYTQLERGERPNHDDQKPKRILTLEEIQALLAHAETEQGRCLLELLLTSGLRIGEALGLTIADLDPEHSIIRVTHQLARDGTRTPLKTPESQRALDIPPDLTRRLLALVTENGNRFQPHAFLFTSRNNTGLQRKTARTILDRAAKTAGLAAPKPTLHNLRDSHASMLIALGYDVVTVQKRLGHRKPDTTLRTYIHQWAYHNAQKSQIGQHLQQLLTHDPTAEREPTTSPTDVRAAPSMLHPRSASPESAQP